MSEATRNFLIKLTEDPDLRARFKDDPQAVMKEYGLPADHQELIAKGDKEGVVKAAGLQDVDVQLLIF